MSILQKLNNYLIKSDNFKSSYWMDKLDNKKYLDTKKFLGFGTFTKDNLFSSFFHKFFQKKIYGNEIFTTENTINIEIFLKTKQSYKYR